MPTLTKSPKKNVKKSKSLSSKIEKKPPLYSQLRKRIYAEEKFLLLRQKYPAVKWELIPSLKVSFTQSQEINKRTNLALQELRRIREDRIKDYQEKTSWSLRKQRAKIRKVRGKIDEVAYQEKLQQLLGFKEKKSAYKGKLAREQYWSKKFRASPISLAQAGLVLHREQPPDAPDNDIEALKFRFLRSKPVPSEVWNQLWLSRKERTTATFSTVFLPSPFLRKIETTREPLISDKLKEYQYKLNFYELFGHPPRSEKEIRKFASIDWEKEKKNYELLWKIKRRSYEKLDTSLLLLPWGPSRWRDTQKQILQFGTEEAWWKQAGEEELALTVTRLHQLVPPTKFWESLNKRYQVQQSFLSKNHPHYELYIYQYSQNYRLDQINKQYLNIETWNRGQKIASTKWIVYLVQTQEQLESEGISSQLHLDGLFSSFILSKCSIHCQCNVIGGTKYYETNSSLPWCETCRVFNKTTNFFWADKSSHPPLAPHQCRYLNSSQWSREEYGKVSRWIQCGSLMPQEGDTWHHDFDALHRGSRGWGCHLGFPQVRSKKQKSRSTIVKMEW